MLYMSALAVISTNDSGFADISSEVINPAGQSEQYADGVVQPEWLQNCHALDNATPIDKICRFKQNDDGLILNLARDSGECVVITKEGCSIVPQPDILVQKDVDTLPIENIEFGCSGLQA